MLRASCFAGAEFRDADAICLLKRQAQTSIIGAEGVDLEMLILPPDADILSPVDDHIFKTLMTHPGAKPVLIDVLSSSMDRNVTDAAGNVVNIFQICAGCEA